MECWKWSLAILACATCAIAFSALPASSAKITQQDIASEPAQPPAAPLAQRLKNVLLCLLAPLFVVFHPVLSLYQHNITQFALIDIYRSVLVVLLLGAMVWALSSWCLKSITKGSILSSWLLFLTFLFGPVSLALKSVGGMATFLGRNRVLLGIWGCLVLLVILLLRKTQLPLQRFVNGITLVAAILCVSMIIPIGRYRMDRMSMIPKAFAASAAPSLQVRSKPNLYIIILDGYPRHDVLQREFDYDNTSFLKALQQRGFTIAEGNHSNYCQTALSMASFLNMRYLDQDLQRLKPMAGDRYPLRLLIQHNDVFRQLRQQGYTTAAFASSYAETDLREVDQYLHPPSTLTEFESALIRQTAYGPFCTLQLSNSGANRERMLYSFTHAADPLNTTRPVCVFLHVYACHRPFAFGRHGETVIPYPKATAGMSPAKALTVYRQYFCNQLSFINQNVLTSIDAIQAHEQRPTAILLLGDHGQQLEYSPAHPSTRTTRESQLMNFMAVSLPGVKADQCYAGITPVNLMRMVFNSYFDTKYSPLPDKSLYSPYNNPYRFNIVHESAPHRY